MSQFFVEAGSLMGELRLPVEKDLKMMVKATWKSSYIVILKVKCHKKTSYREKIDDGFEPRV